MLGAGDSSHIGCITDLLSTLFCDPLQHEVSPLYAAAQEGHLEVVRLLMEGGADVNHAKLVCAVSHGVHASMSNVLRAV